LDYYAAVLDNPVPKTVQALDIQVNGFFIKFGRYLYKLPYLRKHFVERLSFDITLYSI